MQNNNGKEIDGTKKLTTTQLILIVGVIVIIAAVAIVGSMVLRKPAYEAPISQNERISGSGVVITAESEVQELPTSEPFTTLMNSVWTFPDGASPSVDAVVGNNKDNTRPLFFEIILEDTEELIYTSPVIPTGSKLTDMTLDVPLKKGDYTAICAYNLLDENEEVSSVVSFVVTLKVLQ